VDVNGAVSLTVLVGLVNGIDAVNESDAQLSECSENGALGLFSADGRKCSGNADAGLCNRSLVFAINFTSNLLAIFFTEGFVVSIAAGSAVIVAVIALARNIALFVVGSAVIVAVITSITAVITLARNIALFVVVSGTTAGITGITGVTSGVIVGHCLVRSFVVMITAYELKDYFDFNFLFAENGQKKI
jgi:hypothetical protein